MAPVLRTVTPQGDPRWAPLVESIFGRANRESELGRILERDDPRFDPSLSLMAEQDGEPAAWTLFLPRRIRLRGMWVPLAVFGPYGTLPQFRGRGLQSFLIETGLSALAERGLRGALGFGDPAFLGRFGFQPAFDLHSVHVPAEILPEESESDSWAALSGEHLAALCDMHHALYAETGGGEERLPLPLDWACAVPDAHTLVWERDGQAAAYVRFRLRDRLEVPECGAVDDGGIDAVLRFLRRLSREHALPLLDLSLPPTHPVARALFGRGGSLERNNLSGGCTLCVMDWPGLLNDVAQSFAPAVELAPGRAISLNIEGTDLRLRRKRGGRIAVESGRAARCHFDLPTGRAGAFFSGQCDFRDLGSSAAGKPIALLQALFPGTPAMWPHGPVFDLAVD